MDKNLAYDLACNLVKEGAWINDIAAALKAAFKDGFAAGCAAGAELPGHISYSNECVNCGHNRSKHYDGKLACVFNTCSCKHYLPYLP